MRSRGIGEAVRPDQTIAYSADGSAWTLIGRHTLVVSPDLPYVGLTSAQDLGPAGNDASFNLFELAEYCQVFMPCVFRDY